MSLLIAAMTIAMCGAAGPAAASETARPNVLEDYVEMGRGYLHLALIPGRAALQSEELERWAAILNASDAQRRFIRVQYDSFLDRHNALMDERAPAYLDLAATASTVYADAGGNSPEFASVSATRERAAARLMREIERVEREFIESLSPVLSEEQAERLPVLYGLAGRRQCRASYGLRLRWSTVELREHWDHFVAARDLPGAATEIEAILMGYETQLTPLVCRQAEMYLHAAKRVRRLNIEQRARTFDEAAYAHGAAWRMAADAAKRVRNLNIQTLASVAGKLPAEAAAQFIFEVRAEVYPELYPDPASLKDMLRAIAADRRLDADARAALEALSDSYTAEYAGICRDLEALCLEWDEGLAKGRNGYQRQFLPGAMEPLLNARRDLSRRFLERTVELVGNDIADPYRALVPHLAAQAALSEE
jgi:hypothetical protein